MLTIPVSVFFLSWGVRTNNLYDGEKLHFGLLNKENVLLSVGRLSFVYLVDDLKTAFSSSRRQADFNLYISEDEINSLNQGLPSSGLSYKPAYMAYSNGNLEKIKLRYRGDSTYHWLFKEKSYRVKTQKKTLWEGLRKFNLIVPKSQELLMGHMTYKLAESLGLLAPTSKLVTMSINGRFDGVRLFAEQVDEGFLRRRQIMPGDIYSGDNFMFGRFWGLSDSLFETSLNWEKASVNNHYDPLSKAPLQAMITKLSNNDFSMLDMEQFGLYAAYMDVSRSRHHDEIHNWKLLYDHYREKFYPIIWDGGAWAESFVDDGKRGGVVESTFMARLYRDHDFLYAKQKALITFFNVQQDDFLEVLGVEAGKARDKAGHLGRFVNVDLRVMTRDEVLQGITDFGTKVRQVLLEVKAETVEVKGGYLYAPVDGGVRLEVQGVPVDSIRIEFSDAKKHVKVKARYISDGLTIERDLTSRTVQRQKSVSINQRLFPASLIESGNHSFTQSTFDLLLTGADTSEIAAVWVTPLALDSREVKVEPTVEIGQRGFQNERNIIPESKIYPDVTFSGEKLIKEFQLIRGDLVIQPGTRLLFSEGAGLKLLGKVLALGTKEEPITFTGSSPEQPWGALVLTGQGADASRLEYCIFENGSGIKNDLSEYTAMLTIHDVDQVEIVNSVFRNSHLTDDMVHVVYGEVRIENRTFENAFADAIDLDMSTAEIINSKISHSGNDALDLMSSTVLVKQSELLNSGDKGISIGERSKLFLVNGRVVDNKIGLQCKDDSACLVHNTRIIDNKIGVDASQKNWQYGNGGNLVVKNSVILNNLTSSTSGKKSTVSVVNSYINGRLSGASTQNEYLEVMRSDTFFMLYAPLVNDDVIGLFQ